MNTTLADNAGARLGSRVRGGTGAWAWIAQRVTGALLVLFLGAHWWLLHWDITGQSILFERVAQRLQHPFFIFLDVGLLGFALYHALNGLRAVLMDLWFGPRIDRPLSLALLVLGVVTFLFGVNALLPFITGEPIFSR